MKKKVTCAFLCAMILCGFSAYTSGVHAQAPVFTRTLSIGDEGPDVLALQKYLNIPSPNAYFGSQTAAAVREFQLKYASSILTPYGLKRPTGIVGSATIVMLNALMAARPAGTAAPAITTNSALVNPISGPTNPNLRNIDKIFGAVERVMTKKNASASQIADAKRLILQSLSTSTDLQKQFMDIIRPVTAMQSDEKPRNGFAGLFRRVEQAFSSLIYPENVYATVGVPFGGYEFVAYPCTCTAGLVWAVGVEPLPPSYVTFLSYTVGTQMYANHTLPFAIAMLGHYVPGVNACIMGFPPYCSYNPTIEGSITPVTGSSL